MAPTQAFFKGLKKAQFNVPFWQFVTLDPVWQIQRKSSWTGAIVQTWDATTKILLIITLRGSNRNKKESSEEFEGFSTTALSVFYVDL